MAPMVSADKSCFEAKSAVSGDYSQETIKFHRFCGEIPNNIQLQVFYLLPMGWLSPRFGVL
jgi:hypothetical protein